MENKIFLAIVSYDVTQYMGDTLKFETTKLVYAKDEKEAEDKINSFFELKTSVYNIYYTVTGVEISEPII